MNVNKQSNHNLQILEQNKHEIFTSICFGGEPRRRDSIALDQHSIPLYKHSIPL